MWASLNEGTSALAVGSTSAEVALQEPKGAFQVYNSLGDDEKQHAQSGQSRERSD